MERVNGLISLEDKVPRFELHNFMVGDLKTLNVYTGTIGDNLLLRTILEGFEKGHCPQIILFLC